MKIGSRKIAFGMWIGALVGVVIWVGVGEGSPPVSKKDFPPEKSAGICFMAGLELAKKGHDREAIEQLERARQFQPQLGKVAHHLGVLYGRTNQKDKAFGEFKKALEQAPRDAELAGDVGYFYYTQDQFKEAESWLRHSLILNPQLQRSWTHLGMALGQQGRVQESYQAFAKIMPPGQALGNVGILLAKQGKMAEARHYLQQALNLEPQQRSVQAVLARLDRSQISSTGQE
jgi:Tfp pilus assembly protein PilF